MHGSLPCSWLPPNRAQCRQFCGPLPTRATALVGLAAAPCAAAAIPVAGSPNPEGFRGGGGGGIAALAAEPCGAANDDEVDAVWDGEVGAGCCVTPSAAAALSLASAFSLDCLNCSRILSP